MGRDDRFMVSFMNGKKLALWKGNWHIQVQYPEKVLVILLVIFTLFCIPATASVAYSTSSPQILAKGDTLTINGTDARNGSVSIWVIGRDYFKVMSSDPDGNGNYLLSIPPEETARFSSGQYAIMIQDPGTNGKPDVGYRVEKNENISLMNNQDILVNIGPPHAIGANAEPIVRIILEGTAMPGIDDFFTSHSFIVEESWIHFDQKSPGNPDGQLPNLTEGYHVTLMGTTNTGVENSLHADIRNLDTNTLVSSETIPVIAGSDTNRWSFDLNTSGLPPGEYFVTVGWMKTNTTGTASTMFTIVSGHGSAPVSQDRDTPENSAGGKIPLPFIAGGMVLTGIVCVSVMILSQKKA